MLIRKKAYFNQIFAHLYHSFGNYPNTITLSYSVEYLTRIIMCESVLGVSHMPYVEDFTPIQFAIFKSLSYCLKETIGFDVKASFADRPVSRLIR